LSTGAQRLDSLRTVLREYLVALDTDNEFVAELLSRCTLDPRAGSAVLLLPLARLRDRHRARVEVAPFGARLEGATVVRPVDTDP